MKISHENKKSAVSFLMSMRNCIVNGELNENRFQLWQYLKKYSIQFYEITLRRNENNKTTYARSLHIFVRVSQIKKNQMHTFEHLSFSVPTQG